MIRTAHHRLVAQDTQVELIAARHRRFRQADLSSEASGLDAIEL